MSYSKIVKLASGNVQLQDASDNPIKTLQPAANLELLPNGKGVRVMQWQGESTDLLISEIDYTRLDPAGDVAFTGDAQDLLTLISDSFFFELEGGDLAPDYPISSSFYSFKANDSKSAQSVALNTLVASKIYIPFDSFTVSRLFLRYSAAVVGASVLGIYTIGTDGYPDELIVQTTAYNTNLTSSQGVSITPTLLNKGYYAVVYHSNATNSINALSNASNYPNWGSASTVLATNVYASLTASLAYTGTLPAVFPSSALSVSVPTPYIIFE